MRLSESKVFGLKGTICTHFVGGKAAIVDVILIDVKRIVFAGGLIDVDQYIQKHYPKTDVQFLNLPQDSLALPGFQDAHIHPLHGIIFYE
jgi:predicted amidohydrolase YtcJ